LYLIVGLGNPGPDYMHTRHNVGFDCLDMLASDIGASLDRTRFRGYFGEGRIGTEKVLLLKPSTYMNLSGESVGEAAAFYKIPPENIILIYDDISLEVGRLRIRKKGSPGGHNGIKSVTAHLGTDVFPRVKIGIGGPQRDLVRACAREIPAGREGYCGQDTFSSKGCCHCNGQERSGLCDFGI